MNNFVVIYFLVGISASICEAQDFLQFHQILDYDLFTDSAVPIDNGLDYNQNKLKHKIDKTLNNSCESLSVFLDYYHQRAVSKTNQYYQQRFDDLLREINSTSFEKDSERDCKEARKITLSKFYRFRSAAWTSLNEDLNDLYTRAEESYENFEKKYSLKSINLDIFKSPKAQALTDRRLYDIAIGEAKEVHNFVFNVNAKLNYLVRLLNAEEERLKNYLRRFCGNEQTIVKAPLTREELDRLNEKLTTVIFKFIRWNFAMNMTVSRTENHHRQFTRLPSNVYTWSSTLKKLNVCNESFDGYTEEDVYILAEVNQRLLAFCFDNFAKSCDDVERTLEDYQSDPLEFMRAQNVSLGSDFESHWTRFTFEIDAKFASELDEIEAKYIQCMDKIIPIVIACAPRGSETKFE